MTAHPERSRERKPEEESHLLYVLLKCYYTGDKPPHGLAHLWASQAVIYLNAIFTCGQRMADYTIVEAHAIAVAKCAKSVRTAGPRASACRSSAWCPRSSLPRPSGGGRPLCASSPT